MYHHIKGQVVEANPTYAVIETGGVGYLLNISLQTYTFLNGKKEALLLTELIVREDAQLLYGFYNRTEREMFKNLISVSGIGPNTGILMLSSLSPSEIATAITSEDVNTIKSIKGIGLKTAQRVIIDLKDKVSGTEINLDNINSTGNTTKNEALTALLSLGFNKNTAEKALAKVKVSSEDSVESVIKEALKIL